MHEGTWQLDDVSADGRSLSILVLVSGCTSFSHSTVEEAADRVHLRVIVETRLPDRQQGLDTACGDELGIVSNAVVLEGPLGSRELHGACQGTPPDELTCELIGQIDSPA